MKKGILITAASAALVMVAGQSVSAKTYKAKAVNKAIVYTSKGQKTKKKIKKNQLVKVYGKKTIRKKKFLRIGKGKYVKAVSFTTSSKQFKKITRTIKLYKPTGLQSVKQNAYVKRIVKTNLGTSKKSYGKWTTSSFKAYKVQAVAGYTANKTVVQSQKVYSWTKNTTVKVTYKKNEVTSKAISTSNSTKTSTKKSTAAKASTKKVKVLNPWNEKKEQMAEQGILQVINDFRSQVGLPALTLNTQFRDLLNQRAKEKSQQLNNGVLPTHDGAQTIAKIIKEKSSWRPLETLHRSGITMYDVSDQEQVDTIVNYFKDGMQAEKEDYDAIYVNHTRTNITNDSGTVGHYSVMINKAESTSGKFVDRDIKQVAIGLSPYYSNPEDGAAVAFIVDFLY